MNTETIFPEGFYLNKVSDSAPSFIVTNQSIHRKKAIEWLTAHQNLEDEKGFIKLVGKESKEGKRYFQVDTWKPSPRDGATAPSPSISAGQGMADVAREFKNGEVNPADVPF